MQYLWGIGVFFFIAGFNAMLIRTNLLRPSPPVFSPGQYLTIVGLHGSMMVMMVSSIILGPFGHYLVPLMIGARRMAFPRMEALTFWLTPLSGVVLMSAISYGGFPTGWTGYPPLALQANAGMDAYIFAFFLVAVAMILNAVNLMVTIITMRAPGLTWNRLPIFVWSMLATTVLMLLGAPVLVAGLLMEALDRTSGTTFFVAGAGGSPFLFENLFWFFGHPEVYILALPGFGIVLEILPVFARKPLWGYRLAVSGLLGVALLSFMVWQHHLFVSGINSNLRPFYMFTTELISVPTGFVFLAGMGTLWRARIRFTVPMLFSLAFFFNFLIGGLSGVFLSDVPSDVTLHGSYFVMAHFHYTIMGGLVFAFFGRLLLLAAEDDRAAAERAAGQDPLLDDVRLLQLDLPAAVRAGPAGHAAARLDLRPAPADAERLGVGVGLRARHLDAGLPGQLGLVLGIARIPADANPWQSRGLEWQLPTPVPLENFDEMPTILAGPYEYGDANAQPVARLGHVQPAVAGD